ncbi:MAG TPA: hypothetical protein VHR86_01155, partial [Armatimonadota bacterium]|nr:hypothetical protein [Armatimonadota bacterium]
MHAKENPHEGGRQSDCGHHFTTPRYDFDQIDAALLPRADTLLNEWLPDGKLSGHEYTAINPTRADHHPGSFKINIDTGIWEDFATGDKGPGLVSLYAYIHRMDKPDAATELAQRHGLQAASARDKPPTKARPREEWQPVMPIPDDAPPPPTYTAKLGETVTRYDYRGIDGRLLHLVYRVDRASADGKKGKDFYPVTWCQHKGTGAHDWRWKAIPEKRPLYGLETLTEDTVGFPACISEGEKAVQAARQLMPGFVCLTSSGGSKGAGKTDWTSLIGRRVVIWPDADKPGMDYAWTVAKELRQVGVTDVHIINVSAVFGAGMKEGFDAADALARGWTAERLGRALAADDALLPPEEDDEPADGLPAIRSIPGNLDKVIRNAERVLIDSGIPVFDRGGQVVRPVMLMADVPMDGGTLPAGSLAIMDVSAGWLTLIWNRIAAWYAKARDGFKRIDCPSKYATLYLDAAGMWTLPVLTGIVEAPTIRPDGTLLTQPGYDPRSGLFLDYTGLPVTVPEYPTQADALAALAVLKHVIREFPFVNEAARSVALSSQMTAAVRRALRTAPFHVFDSPEKGTGKGLLANIASIIATGRQPTTATLTTSPDENQKKLESYLVRGVSFLNIDNASKPVEGDLLCSLATEETVAPRILGQTKYVTVRTNTMTVTITGNNLIVAGDLTRRALVSRIDAQMERPDARSFEIPDLKRHVAEHRHELLAACLTMVRAYIVAGCPPH